jgi:hypothetical protein
MTNHLPEFLPLTKEAIESLCSSELRAIVRSTDSRGRFWQQLIWAQDELGRRYVRQGLLRAPRHV